MINDFKLEKVAMEDYSINKQPQSKNTSFSPRILQGMAPLDPTTRLKKRCQSLLAWARKTPRA